VINLVLMISKINPNVIDQFGSNDIKNQAECDQFGSNVIKIIIVNDIKKNVIKIDYIRTKIII
jgi:hypothetical protein